MTTSFDDVVARHETSRLVKTIPRLRLVRDGSGKLRDGSGKPTPTCCGVNPPFIEDFDVFVECRRGVAFFSRGFRDLDADPGAYHFFPFWYCHSESSRRDVFVDDAYVFVFGSDVTETHFRVFVFDRARREGRRLRFEHVYGRNFFSRWNERVRTNFYSTKASNESNHLVFVAAWFRDASPSDLRWVVDGGVETYGGLCFERKEDGWRCYSASFLKGSAYVESRDENGIVVRRIDDVRRRRRFSLRLAPGESVDVDEDGLLVVEGDDATRIFDLDVAAAEKIDVVGLPTDVKRDVFRKAAFVGNRPFDFS